MKKALLVPLTFFLFFLIGCGSSHEITEEDEAIILETVEDYYRALENKNYSMH